MPALNFKEISAAHIPDGTQDTFELFARDFSKLIGLEVISGPDRGQDGGRDLIAIEKRDGIMGTTKIKWLISCKHKAHSGESVKDGDENDILDRVNAHEAQGFIGFYSTVISAPLNRKLEGLRKKIEIKVFDHEIIEHELLNNTNGKQIAKRYFPISFDKWQNSILIPINVYSKYEPLKCMYCGKDLLDLQMVRDQAGIVVFVSDNNYAKDNDYQKELIVVFYWACKGKCDRILEQKYRVRGFSTGWEDISDIAIPIKYLSWNLTLLNNIQSGYTSFAKPAIDNLNEFILKISQFTLKQPTEEQIERYKELLEIPYY